MKMKRSWPGWMVLTVLVAGLGLYLLSPSVMAVVLPYALLAACPISMLLMMKFMHGDQDAPQEGETDLAPEERLVRLKAQHAALDEKIGTLEQDASDLGVHERR